MGDQEGPVVPRDEVDALLATRRELGPDYEQALVDSFAARVEAAVADRSRQVAQRGRTEERQDDTARTRQFALGVVSLGVGVPVTIVPTVATDGGGAALAAVAVGWLGIVGVNAAHALASRRRRD